jgi:hypothetical protein
MADLLWPDNLPGPQVSGFGREEVVGFIESNLASGPSFIQPVSEDTPSFHSVTYKFKNGDARRFQLWLRTNKIKTYSPFFDGPLITEDGSIETQECRFTADGYPQLQSKTNGGIWTYSARLLTREIVNGDDEFATELIAVHGVNCGNINLGNSLLDQGMII